MGLNPIDKKRLEYAAKIREVGSRIRVQKLDRDDLEDTPERDALSTAIFSEYGEDVVKEGLEFAAYLASAAEAACTACGGLGARHIARCDCGGDLVDGAFVHTDKCKDGVATEAYAPCECAARYERKRREQLPAARVKSTKRANLDQRIAKVEQELRDAEAKRNDALAPIDADIAAFTESTKPYQEERRRRIVACESSDALVIAQRKVVDDLRLRLRNEEESLRTWQQNLEDAEGQLDEHEREGETLRRQEQDLFDRRSRVARHHAPAIERATKLLRRLTYLRGDKVVTSEEVKVSFKTGDVG